jgi:hypothetical protein
VNRIVMKSKVGGDGVLHLDVPLGPAEADQEVQVTVESTPRDGTNEEEWRNWVQSMAGSWQGEFERPPQGQFEQRDSLQ